MNKIKMHNCLEIFINKHFISLNLSNTDYVYNKFLFLASKFQNIVREIYNSNNL